MTEYLKYKTKYYTLLGEREGSKVPRNTEIDLQDRINYEKL